MGKWVNKTLKVLDLFSGIGGFSLGLERTGHFETITFCEFDKNCQMVLKKHWPHVPILNDIRTLTGCRAKNTAYLLEDSDFSKSTQKYLQVEIKEPLRIDGGIDVICGGFPCTDISVAGLKKGFTNENGETTRSGLWFEFKRIISEVMPKYVIIENVRNLLNLGLARVLKDLDEIGYDAEWRVISAKSIGACHLRERVWIVAYPKCVGQTQPQHEDREGRKTTRLEKELFERFGSDTSPIIQPRIFKPGLTPISDWWKVESKFFRVDDGFPERLDKDCIRRERIKQLGNSVVPQIVGYIGKLIAEEENL